MKKKNKQTTGWVEVGGGCWEYWNYKSCYLTIREENGKYIPAVNGSTDIHHTKAIDHSPVICDTVEEAKQKIYDYIDWVRNIYSPEYAKQQYAQLNTLRPDVYIV